MSHYDDKKDDKKMSYIQYIHNDDESCNRKTREAIIKVLLRKIDDFNGNATIYGGYPRDIMGITSLCKKHPHKLNSNMYNYTKSDKSDVDIRVTNEENCSELVAHLKEFFDLYPLRKDSSSLPMNGIIGKKYNVCWINAPKVSGQVEIDISYAISTNILPIIDFDVNSLVINNGVISTRNIACVCPFQNLLHITEIVENIKRKECNVIIEPYEMFDRNLQHCKDIYNYCYKYFHNLVQESKELMGDLQIEGINLDGGNILDPAIDPETIKKWTYKCYLTSLLARIKKMVKKGWTISNLEEGIELRIFNNILEFRQVTTFNNNNENRTFRSKWEEIVLNTNEINQLTTNTSIILATIDNCNR